MMRLGLCCIFKNEPIKFRQTTARALLSLSPETRLERCSKLCLHNLKNLYLALKWLEGQQIKAFRVLSPLFPRYTHPEVGYDVATLPDYHEILDLCLLIRRYQQSRDLRLSLHPDQFNVLCSPRPEVVSSTLTELEYQGLLAELIGADVINIHGGGVYGDKSQAIKRFKLHFNYLSDRVKTRLSLENDDVSYRPEDLLPLCNSLGIPFVYDVHHHRCLPDRLSLEKATELCLQSWSASGKEPYFHISSPARGWQSSNPKPHADYIDPADFPAAWLPLQATVDVEAKAKELAVLKLKKWLQREG